MSCIKLIGRNTYKMTLQELCNLYNNRDNIIVCSIITNKDYRMPESNVDKYLYLRFSEKCLNDEKKILCKK